MSDDGTQTDWPVVGIVIVNWNNYTDTAACLDSLRELSYPDYHVIVVDNGSTDGSGERLASEYGWVEFVSTDRNFGFGGGCNVGIEEALAIRCDHVLLLNNDAALKAGALHELVTVAETSGVGVVGAMIRDESGTRVTSGRNKFPDMLFYSGYRDNLPFVSDSRAKLASRQWWKTDRIEGAGVLLSRQLLEDRLSSVGNFLDDSLFMYCEEVELAMWCREHNRDSVVAEDAVVVHEGGNSSNRAFQFYYLTRNRILIAHRYLSGPTRAAFDLLYLFSRLALAARKYRNGNDGSAKAIVRGLIDGHRHLKGMGTVPS